MVQMVEVGDKPAVKRTAKAEGWLVLKPESIAAIAEGRIKKIPTSGYVKFKGQVYAERIEYILQFIFSDTPDAKKIWNKSFLKI